MPYRLKPFIYIFITTLFCGATNAQQSALDSLLPLLKVYTKADTSRASVLTGLAYAYHEISTDSTLYFANEGLRLSIQINSDKYKAKSLNYKAIAMYQAASMDESLELFNQALKLYESLHDDAGIGTVYNNLAVIYHDQNEYQKALEYYEKGLKYRIKARDWKNAGASYNNIGNVYFDLGNYTQSLVHHFKGLSLRERYDDRTKVSNSYANISAVYFDIGNYAKSLQYAQRSLMIAESERLRDGIFHGCIAIGTIYDKQGNNKEAIAYFNRALTMSFLTGIDNSKIVAFYFLGNQYVNAGRYDSATYYLNKALRIAIRLNEREGQLAIHNAFGRIDINNKNYSGALVHLNKALSIAEVIGNRQRLYETLELLSVAYDKLNNYKEAHVYLKRYMAIKDTIHLDAASKKIHQVEFDYLMEKNRNQIALLQKDKELQMEKNANATMFALLLVGIVLLLLILILFLVLKHQREIKSRKLIALQKAEIERQAAHLTQLNSFKDKTFSTISHDLRGPLASLTGMVELFNHKLLSIDEFLELKNNLSVQLVSINKLLDGLLEWGKLQMTGNAIINPSMVNIYDLVQTNQQLFKENLALKKITFINEVNQRYFVYADYHQVEICIRNIINNAIKFTSQHGTIKCSCILTTKDKVNIIIADNGVGMSTLQLNQLFSIKQVGVSTAGTEGEQGSGIGMILVKELIERNNGKISIDSELGRGTTVTLELPVKQTR